jgi:predicted SAM-dependent methyltransferase
MQMSASASLHPSAAKHNNKIVRCVKRVRPLVTLIKNAQRYAGLLARPIAVSRYLNGTDVRKLQIGADVCALPGWLNTDLYPQKTRCVTLDPTRRFPFPDSSFDYVFSEHQIEHVGYEEGVAMLKECYRILRSGGKIRIATPCLDRLVGLSDATSDLQHRYMRAVTNGRYPSAPHANRCFAINGAFMHWGHKFLYDSNTLRLTLEQVGFTDVRFFTPRESDDANLAGVETRASEMDIYETMVAQAVRS